MSHDGINEARDHCVARCASSKSGLVLLEELGAPGAVFFSSGATTGRRFESGLGFERNHFALGAQRRSGIVVQDDVQQGTMHAHVMSEVVFDKPESSEPIHEETNSRTGGTDHLGESLLTQAGDGHFGNAFFAEVSHEKKDARETFFTGIKKLIDEIILIADVSLEQIFHEKSRQLRFAVEREHHRLFLDVEQDAIGHGRCG